MTKNAVAKTWSMPESGGRRYSDGPPDDRFFMRFVPNDTDDDDDALIDEFPPGWGDGEWTFTVLLRPMQAGSTAWGTIDVGTTNIVKKRRWSSDNSTIYSSPTWWVLGNFIWDAYNNLTPQDGSFSGQLTNTGRVQVLISDGAAAGARNGDSHGLRGTTNIIDGNWHRITVVRRSDGGSGSIFELWVDGVLEDTETSTSFTTMYTTYWQNWTGFPIDEPYLALGAEKISGNDGNPWEDYMGDMAELAFIRRALTEAQCEDWESPIGIYTDADEDALYLFNEQTGTNASDLYGNGGDIVRRPNTDAAPLWGQEAA